ncbi:hypothetical protein [Acidiphilium angustum]|uniref:hypothetical protein n=1 Tax=Acidiphilium angustum TaxID=523 RepID=UPI0012DDFAD1|nr:hypothetical protein [Acidiphilium angustum]
MEIAMQPANSVSALFAQIQAYKALWAGSRPKEAAFERYLTAGQNADATLFETRAHGLPEVLLKLVELMDWLHDDATPISRLHPNKLDSHIPRSVEWPWPNNQIPTGARWWGFFCAQ